MNDKSQIVAEKIARLKAAISLEPHDRVPVAAMADFWPVRLTEKYTMQDAFYNMDIAAECYRKAFGQWDDWDGFNPLLQSIGPLMDATGSRRYNVPGRDLSPNAEFQHPDPSLMDASEYPELIQNPMKFHAEKVIPRLCTRIGSEDPFIRSIAWTKAALFFSQYMAKARNYAGVWANEYGIPPVFQGQTLYVPIDWLADKVRGFHNGLLDIKQHPEELQAACEALVPFITDACLASAPSTGEYPLIFNPQHVSPFLSPKDYQKIYWPTFKKMMDDLTQRGYKVWIFFEHNQEQHLDCLQELPKGKVVAQFESTDFVKAKKALGGKICIAGGMPAMLLTRGTPEEVRQHTLSMLKLFEDEPGFIMSCSTVMPSTAKPENVTAWLETMREHGRLAGGAKRQTEGQNSDSGAARGQATTHERGVITTWETVRSQFGKIQGDEQIIKENWESLETLSLTFLYWMLR